MLFQEQLLTGSHISDKVKSSWLGVLNMNLPFLRAVSYLRRTLY